MAEKGKYCEINYVLCWGNENIVSLTISCGGEREILWVVICPVAGKGKYCEFLAIGKSVSLKGQ